MKLIFKTYILLITTSLLSVGCESTGVHNHDKNSEIEAAKAEHQAEEESEGVVHLSTEKFNALGIKTDTVSLRNMSKYVEVNGTLEVPPQSQASVTAVVGANVVSIHIIEGEKVSKGQVLAYLSHPNLIKIQTDYVDSWSQLQYQEAEDKRQEKLYEEKVGSGKEYQRVHADYLTTKAMTKGFEVQLVLMGLSASKIRDGYIYDKVPLRSPIDGYVRLVQVKIGQYVRPETEMFQIINVEDVHADFMVFEKDMHSVKEGMKVVFTSESLPGKEMIAEIHSVGKSFEEGPKAIHLHAEIENKEGLLIPGMYVRGRIITNDSKVLALPLEAIATDGEKSFVFSVAKETHGGEEEYEMIPIEVILGIEDNGWVEVKFLGKLDPNLEIATNKAYYIIAEMNKGEVEHSH